MADFHISSIKVEKMKNPILVAVVCATISLAGCASTHNVRIYTAEEKAGMTEDGAIATMITPSELRELAKNAGKANKPTGHVSYCNAGLLSVSARAEALKAIDGVCGGNGQYAIVRAVPLMDAVNTAVGTSCVRSEMVIFRCNGVKPK